MQPRRHKPSRPSPSAKLWAVRPEERRWVLGLAALAFLAFAPSLGNGFTFDDRLVIESAQGFLRTPDFSAFFSRRYFSLSHESTYRPVVTLSYMLDMAVGGMSPWAYHLQSVLWHVGVVLLTFVLGRRLAPQGPVLATAFGAALFAVHPVLTEAVDNASFREDPLATFFVLLALLYAVRARPSAGLWVAYAAALFSKESAIVLPVLYLGVRLLFREEAPASKERMVRELVGLGAVTGVYALIRFGPLASSDSYASYPGAGPWATFLTMPQVFLHYVRLTVAPWPLCPDYTGVFDFSTQTLTVGRAVGFAALLLFMGVTTWALRARKGWSLGLAWFLVSLAPVSNLLPLPIPAAERFLYLPLVGLALGAGLGAGWLLPRLEGRARQGVYGAGAAALVGLGLVTQIRHPDWESNFALWSQAVRQFPTATGAQHGLGTQLVDAGRLDEAEPYLLQALAGTKDSSHRAMMENDLGILYGKRGQFALSESHLRQALELHPDAKTCLNLALTLLNLGKQSEATELLQRAITVDPNYGRAYAILGSLQKAAGNPEGERLLQRAHELAPVDPVVQQSNARPSPP